MARAEVPPEQRQLLEKTLEDARDLAQQMAEAREAGIGSEAQLREAEQTVARLEAMLRIF